MQIHVLCLIGSKHDGPRKTIALAATRYYLLGCDGTSLVFVDLCRSKVHVCQHCKALKVETHHIGFGQEIERRSDGSPQAIAPRDEHALIMRSAPIGSATPLVETDAVPPCCEADIMTVAT